MKRSMLLPVLLLACAVSARAEVSVYETKYVDGTAPVTIDGSLDEWESLSLRKAVLDQYKTLGTETAAPATVDLSGWFSCIADNSNIYVAVSVTDDVVVTGNHEYGRGWMDDVVEVCFDGDLLDTAKNYFDVNDGQVIVVGENGKLKWLEGLVPGLIAQIPYYWDARGVRAGYRLTDGGYTVEILIPNAILGKSSMAGQRVGINIRVLEDDNETDGTTQGVLSWANDPELTSSWKTERYNQVAFIAGAEVAPTAVYDAEVTTTAVSIGAQELLVDLGTVESQTYKTVMTTVHEKLHAQEWVAAIDALAPVKEKIWAKSMMGAVGLHNKDYRQAVVWLHEYASSTGDGVAHDWALNYLREFALDMIYSDKFKQLYPKKPCAAAAFIMNEHLKKYPADTKTLDALKGALSFSDSLDAGELALFREVISAAATPEIAEQTKLALARGCFCNGDYEQAGVVANELINTSANSKIVLDARMVLLSIDEAK